jgi:hypothetical protein
MVKSSVSTGFIMYIWSLNSCIVASEVGRGVAAVAVVVVERDEGDLQDLVAVLDADVGVALVRAGAAGLRGLGELLLAPGPTSHSSTLKVMPGTTCSFMRPQ